MTWPEQKAPRLQAVLRAVAERHGSLSLDFLGAMPVEEARAWLESIPGIGPKTSAAVLSFSVLRKAALPVDSHHHRVAQRTGLIAQSMNVGPSHVALAALLPGDSGCAGGLRPPRSHDDAWPALLFLQESGLRALRHSRSLPDRAGKMRGSTDERRAARRKDGTPVHDPGPSRSTRDMTQNS